MTADEFLLSSRQLSGLSEQDLEALRVRSIEMFVDGETGRDPLQAAALHRAAPATPPGCDSGDGLEVSADRAD